MLRGIAAAGIVNTLRVHPAMLIIVRTRLTILALTLLVAGCGNSPTSHAIGSPRTSVPPAHHSQTFTSSAYRFSVTYDAEQFTSKGDTSGLSDPSHGLLVVDFITKGVGGIEISAFRESREVGSGVVREILRSTVEGMNMPADQRRAVKPVTVGGIPGFEVAGSAEGAARVEVFAVGHGRYAYIISIGATAKAWNMLRPSLEAAVQSFRVLP